MKKTPKNKPVEVNDLEQQHRRLFSGDHGGAGLPAVEWTKEGDVFTKFTLYTDLRTPILSDRTFLTTDSHAKLG